MRGHASFQVLFLHSGAMTSAESLDSDPASLIREVMHRARQVMGSGTKLAARFKELGIGPDDGYSESAISNWINGRAMPPADVLLTAAALARMPLGTNLGTTVSASEAEEWRVTVEQLQGQLDELRTDVLHLYGQLGIPRPQGDQRPTQRRSEAG